MEREQLESAKATLMGARDTLAGIGKNGGSEAALAEVIDGVAGVVMALIEDKLIASEHAHAVGEIIKRDAPTSLDHGHGAVQEKPGDWPEVGRRKVDPDARD